MFLINLKRFFKSPIYIFGTLAYIGVLFMVLPAHEMTSFESMSNATLNTQVISFLYFMVMPYEYFYQIKKCRLQEIVAVSRMGLLVEKTHGFLLFMIFDLILCGAFLGISIKSSISAIGAWNVDWVCMLVKTFFLYHYLVYIFAILLGIIVAAIRSRIRGLFSLVLIFSVFSKILYPVIMQSVNKSDYLTHIVDVFGIMNRNYSGYCDLVYNYTTECVNMERIMFWITLSIAVIYIIHNGIKKWMAPICIVIPVIVFACYIRPSGERYVYGDWGAYMDEQHYYELLYMDDKSERIGRTYKTPDFKIKKYEAVLCPKRILEAAVKVTVDNPNLENYRFTLYHGYQIKNITDENGTELTYIQDVDHVLVKTNEKRKLKKICFEYAGYSRKNVSTEQAVYLPGNFPYLPNAGWNEYMIEPVGDSWEVGYNLKGAMYRIDYDIQIDTGMIVYSNLKKTGKGHYVGSSEGATIVASPFVKEMNARNCKIYYPVLSPSYSNGNILESKRQYEDAIDSIEELRMRKKPLIIFDLASVMDSDISWYIAEDHLITTGAEDVGELYSYFKKKGCTIDHTKWDAEDID